MIPHAYPTSRWLHSDMIQPDLRMRSSSPLVEMTLNTMVSSCITSSSSRTLNASGCAANQDCLEAKSIVCSRVSDLPTFLLLPRHWARIFDDAKFRDDPRDKPEG